MSDSNNIFIGYSDTGDTLIINTNGYVGLNTASPSCNLEITGSCSNDCTIDICVDIVEELKEKKIIFHYSNKRRFEILDIR